MCHKWKARSGRFSVNSMRRAAADVARRVKGVTQLENTIAMRNDKQG
jgi:osmotically-inducible protein OsmY